MCVGFPKNNNPPWHANAKGGCKEHRSMVLAEEPAGTSGQDQSTCMVYVSRPDPQVQAVFHSLTVATADQLPASQGKGSGTHITGIVIGYPINRTSIEVHHQDKARGVRANREVERATSVEAGVGPPVKVTVGAAGRTVDKHRACATHGLTEGQGRVGWRQDIGATVAVCLAVISVYEADAAEVDILVSIATASGINRWARNISTHLTIEPKATKSIAVGRGDFTDAGACDAASRPKRQLL